MIYDVDEDERLSLEEMVALNQSTAQSDEELLDADQLQELLFLFDSGASRPSSIYSDIVIDPYSGSLRPFCADSFGLTFAGFLDLYRMEDMDLAADAYAQRLTHGTPIALASTFYPRAGV
jgi:hypothetical protein